MQCICLYAPFRYEHSHGTVMSCSAAAQLLSVTLYYRRFFPYYAFCMIGGIDEDGESSCRDVMVADSLIFI